MLHGDSLSCEMGVTGYIGVTEEFTNMGKCLQALPSVLARW